LIAAQVFLNGLFLFVQNNFRWTLQSLRFAFTSLIFTVLNLIWVGVFVFYLEMGLNGVLIAGIISTIISLVVSLVLQKNYYEGVFSFRYAERILRFSLPLILSAVAVYFSLYLDRILINSFLGLKELAVFGVAFRFAALVGLATTGFSSALTPLIYNDPYSISTKDSIQVLFKHFVRASLLFLIFLTFFSSEILIFLTTDEYLEANILIPIVTCSMIFSSVYVFFPGLTLAKETGKLASINVISSLVNLILCFLFIKRIGVVGVAFSTLISSWVGLILNVLYSKKYYDQSISFLFKDKFVIAVVGVLMGVFLLKPWVFLDSFQLVPFFSKLAIFMSLFLMYVFLINKERVSSF
jgi:O-antigen/teichoic acid export membrane protein